MGRIINENVIWRFSFLDVKKLGRALASSSLYWQVIAIHGACIYVSM
ncbi:hypothetical protein [Paenibacillus sp. Y412MC10]|nr:hypothetical protein [Paenibacillus sp. Y412MC10]